MNYQGIGRYPDKTKLKADEKRLIEKVIKSKHNLYLTPLTLRTKPNHKEFNIALNLMLKGILVMQSCGESDFEGPAKPWVYRRATVKPYFGNLKYLKRAMKSGVYEKTN